MAELSPFEPRGDFIDGRFALPEHGSGEIRLENPADLDSLTGAFPFARESVDAAVAAGRAAYRGWRELGIEQRAVHLTRFANVIESNKEALAAVISAEVGKPLWEARTEVAAMVAKVQITLEQGLDLVASQDLPAPAGQRARWRNHARGVLAVLGPFNFPGHLVHGHVVPALATGNPVVIKPSDKTPAVGQLYAALADEAGFPPGVVNSVQGDGAIGAALAAHTDVDGVLFTGSWGVGRRILEATLDQPWKRVALEMGGKNGVLVWEDADLDAAAHAIAFATCVTTGQRCSATSRVYAHAAVIDGLCERLVRVFEGVRHGDPNADDVFMGPIVSAESRARHGEWLERARADGAEVLVAGGPADGPRRGHWVRPSLHRLAAWSRESRYQSEEAFAPDAFVCPVRELDEAVAALNATDYGLVASVFSRDRSVYDRCFGDVRVGLLNWNATTVGASSRMPFGGVGKSGNDSPAGATSTLYCTYPVACLEVETPAAPTSHPGFPA